MIFSEIYGAYYTVMAKIIEKAIDHPLEKGELRSIVEQHAFQESILTIENSITEEKWQLIKKDGTTPLTNVPTMPLSTLQKRWLKAISLDPRIKLFGDEIKGLEGVEPLFTPEDYYVFDKYGDGDPYEDEDYIQKFRLILDAVKKQYPLKIAVRSRNGRVLFVAMMPEYLEYSEKDDKFRLRGSGRKYKETINLGNIVTCEPYDKETFQRAHNGEKTETGVETKTVEFELYDQRNALERVLLHFAHFKKQVEKKSDYCYNVMIEYDSGDETELLIRILSFGPMIKVTGPDGFIKLIKERLLSQKSCGL